MKYSEVFERQGVLRNIPLESDGLKVSSELAAKIILMRVAYDKEVKSFEDDMQEALKAMKPEGFDERSGKFAKLEDTDRKAAACKEWVKKGSEGEAPACPSEEELEEAEAVRPGKEAYEKELEELNVKYMEARRQKLDEDSGMKGRCLTEKDLSEIISVTGTQGTIKITIGNGQETGIDKEQFLGIVAGVLVE